MLTPEFRTEEERDTFFVERVRTEGTALAETLRTAVESGVSHAIILPQLMIVFRDAFGTMPPEVAGMIAEAVAS